MRDVLIQSQYVKVQEKLESCASVSEFKAAERIKSETGRDTRTVVPLPAERISSSPPSSRTRSRIPATPTPVLLRVFDKLFRRSCGMPLPLSLISSWT